MNRRVRGCRANPRVRAGLCDDLSGGERQQLSSGLLDAVPEHVHLRHSLRVRAQADEEPPPIEMTAIRSACCCAISASEYISRTFAPST